MGLQEMLFGKKEKIEQFPAMTEQQQQLLSQLLGGLGGGGGAMQAGLGGLQSLLGGDTGAFEAPLMRQFQEEIIPSVLERFTGGFGIPGAASAQRSSAFGQQLGAAGAGLSERLGAMRGGLQMQGLGQLSQLLGLGLGAKPYETIFRPETSGLVGGMAPGLGQAGGFGLLKLLGIF